MKYHLVTGTNLRKMRDLIADVLEKDPKKVAVRSNLIYDLDADSLDIYELAYRFEEEFKIAVPDEEIINHLVATNYSVKGAMQLACKYIKQGEMKKFKEAEHVRNYLMERGTAAA